MNESKKQLLYALLLLGWKENKYLLDSFKTIIEESKFVLFYII